MKIELVPGGKVPQRMSDGAVGYDVFARYVELEHTQAFGSGYDEQGVQVHSFPVKDATAKIHLGFKLDCNWSHDAISAGEETHDGGVADCSFLPLNFAAMLLPRSGWGAKYGFRLKNTVGVIDPDYRGEVIMVAEFDECPPDLLDYEGSGCNGCGSESCMGCRHHLSGENEGQPRVGQLLLVPAFVGKLQVVDQLDATERGEGGFCSTGVR